MVILEATEVQGCYSTVATETCFSLFWFTVVELDTCSQGAPRFSVCLLSGSSMAPSGCIHVRQKEPRNSLGSLS